MARILVVDGESAFRTALREALGGQGYEVVEAAEGRQALLALQDASVDIVLVDLFVPGPAGLELLIELQVRWRAGHRDGQARTR